MRRKRVVQRPISETHYENQQRTAYVEQYKTVVQPVPQTYQVPVTQFAWEPYWANRWNPFGQPYIAYRYVPRIHWETRNNTLQIPTIVREVVPTQQTVAVPITTQRMAEEQQISRVAVSITPNPTATTATATAAGTAPASDPFATGSSSVARRVADPAAGGSDWHAADSSTPR